MFLQLCWRLHGGVGVAAGVEGAALGVGGLVVDGGAGPVLVTGEQLSNSNSSAKFECKFENI